MTVLCVVGLVLTGSALGWAGAATAGEVCKLWLDAPQQFHDRLAVVLSFLFGGSWTATISAFLGYLVGLWRWFDPIPGGAFAQAGSFGWGF